MVLPQFIFEMTVNCVEYLFVWNNSAKEIELHCKYDMFFVFTKWKYFVVLAAKIHIATLTRRTFSKMWNIYSINFICQNPSYFIDIN